MYQQTFSDIEYSNRRKTTKREAFLQTMNRVISWDTWVDEIRPFYPEGKRGRPPRDLETMLRMYLLGKWFHLSAAGTEDAINDSYSMRSFMNIDFFKEQVPSETTLLNFRRLIESNKIHEKIFNEIRDKLALEGKVLRKITTYDTIITKKPTINKETV